MTPEVGDIVVIPRPTDEQIEAGTDADGTMLVSVELLQIVEIREPGFYVVKRPESSEPGALAYSEMMGGELEIKARYLPVEYVADAWIQLEGGTPERARIARVYKRHAVKDQPKRVRVLPEPRSET